MSASLFLALAGLYVFGVVGIVVVGTMVAEPDNEPVSLEQRLAVVRSVAPLERATVPPAQPQYFVRGTPKK